MRTPDPAQLRAQASSARRLAGTINPRDPVASKLRALAHELEAEAHALERHPAPAETSIVPEAPG